MSCAWRAASLALGGALLIFASLPALTELPRADRCAGFADLAVCPHANPVVSRSPVGWISLEDGHD